MSQTEAEAPQQPPVVVQAAVNPIQNFINTHSAKVEFNGHNTSSFLRSFNLACMLSNMPDSERCVALPMCMKVKYGDHVQTWREFKNRDWKALQERMLDEFLDEELHKYSKEDLKDLVSKQRKKKITSLRQLTTYYRNFVTISKHLKNRKIIGWQQETGYFLKGVSKDLRKRWDNHRRRQRMDKRQVKAQVEEAAEQVLQEVTDQPAPGIATSTTPTDLEDETAAAARGMHKLRLANAQHQFSGVKEIFEDLAIILEDDAAYPSVDTDSSDDDLGRSKKHKRSKHKKKRHHEETSSDESSSSSESSESSEDETSDDESSRHASRHHHSKHKKAGSTSSKSSGHKDSKEIDKDSVGSITRGIEMLQLFMTTLQQQQQQPQQQTAPFQAVMAKTQPYTHNGFNMYPQRTNAAFSANLVPRPTPASGANAIPLGISIGGRSCHTCGGPHSFKDLANCQVAQDYLRRGVLQQSPTGTLFYRGQPLPLRATLPAHCANFKQWIDDQERQSKPRPAIVNNQQAVPQMNKVVEANLGEYFYIPPGRSSLASGNVGELRRTGGVTIEEVVDVDAGKRTHAAVSPASNASGEVAAKRADQRTEAERVKENQPAQRVRIEEQDKVQPRSDAAQKGRDDEEMTEATTRKRAASRTINQLQQDISQEEVLSQFYETTVSMPLGMMLASAPILAKSVVEKCQKHRVPLEKLTHNAYQYLEDAPTGTIFEVNHAESSLLSKPLGKLQLLINGKLATAIVDGGSQINVMSSQLRQQLNLPLTYIQGHYLKGVNVGEATQLVGKIEEVPIKINGAVTFQEIAVSPVKGSPFLLGIPFLKSTGASLDYHPMRPTTIKLRIEGRQIESTIEPMPEDQRFPTTRQVTGWDNDSDEGN